MLWRSCTLLNLMQGIISTLCYQNSCVPFDFVGDLVGFLLLFLCIQLLYTSSSLTEHDDQLTISLFSVIGTTLFLSKFGLRLLVWLTKPVYMGLYCSPPSSTMGIG